jgi:hypothetical protein
VTHDVADERPDEERGRKEPPHEAAADTQGGGRDLGEQQGAEVDDREARGVAEDLL